MASQVIVRKHRSSSPVFEAVTSEQRPLALENPAEDVHVPRLGSDDLIYIAEFALRNGYMIGGFYVSGRHGSTLDDHELDEVSDLLITSLEGSDAHFTAARLETSYPGHYVTGLRVTSPDMYSVVLRRLGVVETDNPQLVVRFLASAWKKVKFA